MREIFHSILPAVVIFINGAVSAEPAETANMPRCCTACSTNQA
jgi:hypothetical protein